jgi:hypothetical protein
MDPAISESAHAMAMEWARLRTDHNEVAKVASYLRSHLRADDFFTFLETLATDSECLERSNQTAGYYRDIHDVCNRHLGAYRQGSLARTQEMSQILGWAVRLMRYYAGVGVPATERVADAAPGFSATLRDLQTTPETIKAGASSQAPSGPSKKREVVTLVQDAKNGKAQVETGDGETVACTRLPAYPPARKGMRCRAEVTREDGKPQSAVFRRWE